jgi:cell division septal protein FtsQ
MTCHARLHFVKRQEKVASDPSAMSRQKKEVGMKSLERLRDRERELVRQARKRRLFRRATWVCLGFAIVWVIIGLIATLA